MSFTTDTGPVTPAPLPADDPATIEDVQRVATAIHRALMMPLHERKERHRDLMKAVERTDISKWGERFISLLRKNPATPVRRYPARIEPWRPRPAEPVHRAADPFA